MRALVHDPMKITSTPTSFIGWPADRSMYSSARAAAAASVGSSKEVGSGTAPSRGTTWPGLVPQEMWGRISAAARKISLSNTASSSVTSCAQSASACSQASPVGAWGRPST